MNRRAKKSAPVVKGAAAHDSAPAALDLAAIGLEAEFRLVVDGREVAPERLFGTPQHFIRSSLVHREGTSYHLPTGGAVYFDTGVIEIATPAIEIEPGCAARAGRSLWESIRFIREELDAWERRSGRSARLVGFSTHYNVSFSSPLEESGGSSGGRQSNARRTVEELAYLLIHILPVPVLLLAANRRSTGVGVRPRGNRIEVTVDFTPSPSLMVAAATFITGVVREVMAWSAYDVDQFERLRIPIFQPFHPLPHTSRKGWLASRDSFAGDPFAADVDQPRWSVNRAFYGDEEAALLSLRAVAREIFVRFRRAIRRGADPFTFRLLTSIFEGRAPVLMDLPDRPPAYEDVGRLCQWDDLFPERMLCRSRYERVLIRAISGKRLVLNDIAYRPIGMRGWSEVIFERLPERTRIRFPIDFLVRHLEEWEAGR